jgi:hypothetical protein
MLSAAKHLVSFAAYASSAHDRATPEPVAGASASQRRARDRRTAARSDIPVEIQPGDIRNPSDLLRLQGFARTENYKTAPTNFREKSRDYGFFEDQGESVDEIATRFRAKASEVQDVLDARRLGLAALDRAVDDKTAQGIAAELGRGMRVYGISGEDANAMFRRFLSPDEGGKVPSRTAVRQTVDTVGRELQRVGEVQFEGFAGLGGEGSGAMKIPNEFAQKQRELELAIGRVRAAQKHVRELAEGGTAREIAAGETLVKRAKARETALTKELDGLRRGLRQEISTSTRGPSPRRSTSSGESTLAYSTNLASEGAPERVHERVRSSQRSETAPPDGVMTTRPIRPSSKPEGPNTTTGDSGVEAITSPPGRVYHTVSNDIDELARIAAERKPELENLLRESIGSVPGAHLQPVDLKLSRPHGRERVLEKLAQKGRRPARTDTDGRRAGVRRTAAGPRAPPPRAPGPRAAAPAPPARPRAHNARPPRAQGSRRPAAGTPPRRGACSWRRT